MNMPFSGPLISEMSPALLLAESARTVFVIGGVVAFLLVFLIFLAIFVSGYRKAAPDEVLVVSGRLNRFVDKDGKVQTRGFRLVHGGGTFVFPIFENASVLSLNPFSLDLSFPSVAARNGDTISVTAKAQVRVQPQEPGLAKAAESLAGKSANEITDIASQILETALRSTAGSRTASEATQNQNDFCSQWQNTGAPTLANVGLEILTLTLREIR